MAETELAPEELQALEYVLGTMRGAERQAFESSIRQDESMQDRVLFWESRLMDLNQNKSLPPAPEVWENIANSIRAPVVSEKNKIGVWGHWMSMAACLVLGVLIGAAGYWVGKVNEQMHGPSYVAVLSDAQGESVLSATTDLEGESLSLTWHNADKSLSADQDFQLWAISKRDGQVRPLLVMAEIGDAVEALDTAQWRLIQDAEYLLMTIEEEGGSAYDEPSEAVVAKGLCLNLIKQKS